MSALVQDVLLGLASGSVYALLAAGLVVVWRTAGTLNFAQGAFATAGTYAAWALARAGLPLALAFALAAAFAFALGAGAERLIVARARRAGHHGVLLATLALWLLLEGLMGALFGADLQEPLHDFGGLGALRLGEVVLPARDVIVSGVALLLLTAVGLFFRHTRAGLALRAVASDEDGARLVGIDVGRAHTFAWGLAALLGAVAGWLLVPRILLEPAMMGRPLIGAFAAAVVGGLGSLRGALLGGWLLGVAETLAGAYVSTRFQGSLAFLVLLSALLFRPRGLFARGPR